MREVVETAARLELEVLTLYAFSVENWKRPRVEVWTLMNLLKEYLRREREELAANNIRLRVLGRVDGMDRSVRRELDRALDATAGCTGMTLNIALNYSGRCEIVDACRRIVADWAKGEHVDIDKHAQRLPESADHVFCARQVDADFAAYRAVDLREQGCR